MNNTNEIHGSIFNIRQAKIEKAYGDSQENWGDLPVFQGDYINFGYWKNISIGETISKEDRIRSSVALYAYVVNNLNISVGDTVLELGCGRGVGMLDILKSINASKVIGIDISETQIKRAEIKKEKRKTQNSIDILKAKKIQQDLHYLEKQLALTIDNIKNDQKEINAEIGLISQKIDELQKDRISKDLKDHVKVLENVNKQVSPTKFQQGSMEQLQENKQKIEKTIQAKEDMERKIESIELLIASADSTNLDGQKINKIYSVEVFQHIEDFNALAVEIARILAPNGVLSFCAHLSTNHSGYEKLRQEKLLIDDIEVLAPVETVVSAFQNNKFKVNYHSIGEYVFKPYDQWVTQSSTSDDVSHNIFNSYEKGYIDYYCFTAHKLSGDSIGENDINNDL